MVDEQILLPLHIKVCHFFDYKNKSKETIAYLQKLGSAEQNYSSSEKKQYFYINEINTLTYINMYSY